MLNLVAWLLAVALPASARAELAAERVAPHPLETRALVEPEAVLRELPAALEQARGRGAQRELALLQLARANACRVVADWACQRDAGIEALRAATADGHPALRVRGLIAAARGSIALQDYLRGERHLGEAELILATAPDPVLAADVNLAYSSLSYSLGKHAVALEYAERGLAALRARPDAAMRVRLLRNQARALAQLGELARAREALDEGLREAGAVVDPKLSAELLLETARLARLSGDVAAEDRSGAQVLELAARLDNAQLAGQGQEVLGLAALDRGDLATAMTRLSAAYRSFRALKQDRDELRVLRELIRVALASQLPRAEVEALVAEFLALEQTVSEATQSRAAADFDARLRYAESEVELARLKGEAQLAEERAAALTRSNRLTAALVALAGLTLLAFGVFMVQQRRANRRLHTALTAAADARRRLRAVADHIPALIAHFDTGERFQFINAFSERLFGLPSVQVLGRTLREVRGDEVYAGIAHHVAAVLRGEAVSFEGEADVGARHYHFHSSYTPDLGPDGAVRGFYSITFDITALKLAQRELARLARFDSLTGVANRRQLEERLDGALARCRRHGTALALLVLDLDHFKRINDSHGHPVGDDVIRGFAERLNGCVREVDLIARLGGDEFVVLIDDAASAAAAEQIARKIVAAMREPLPTRIGPLRASCSIGIAFSTAPAGVTELIALADGALYEAKAAGRDTWRVAAEELAP